MAKKSEQPKPPVVLLVLDGWGVAPKSEANAIELARKPNFDRLWKNHSHTTLKAAGRDVGLPPDQQGNSEAGHMNIGAGRVVDQDSVMISKAINAGQFFKNPAFLAAFKHTKENNSDLHIMGMLSNGQSAHSDPDHLLALLAWARLKKVPNVYLHLFTDGRDSPPRSSLKMMEALLRSLKNKESEDGKTRSGEWIATVMGRFYAMDRKKDWSRTGKAYHAMVLGEGMEAESPQEAITQAYNRNETDEFIPPYIIKRGGKPIAQIKDNDAVIFFNLRSDRARQLAKPFVQPNFDELNVGEFERKKVLKNLLFVAMTDFGPDLDSILTAYPSEDLKGTLPMALHRCRQLYIAEKEKYAHMTYFINGGYADPVNGEVRELVDSPDIAHYDESPGMAVDVITERVVESLDSYDFIAINFAIPDMVAHTGNLEAGIKSVEIIDKQLVVLAGEVLKRDGKLIITGDHGNAEQMLDLETKEMYTEHTTNPVPLIIVENRKTKRSLSEGKLSDVAPTILKLMDIPQPKEMTGSCLF